MKIDPPSDDKQLGRVSSADVQAATKVFAGQVYRAEKTMARSPHADDSVSVSKTASELSAAVNETQAAARSGVAAPPGKVQALRQAVLNGTLPIDANTLAEAIWRDELLHR
jgi:flagellar biosynthesis anti-sigma factor FlgM